MPPETRPGDVSRLVDTLLRKGEIAEVFRILSEKKEQLGLDKRTELARQAINEFASRLEGSKSPDSDLRRIQDAELRARGLGDNYVDLALAALQAWVEQQQLNRDLQAIGDFAKKGEWTRASSQIARLNHNIIPVAVKKALDGVIQVSHHHANSERLQAALEMGAKNRPFEMAEALPAVDVEVFPVPLRDWVRGLRGLTQLWATAERRWYQAPNIARLKQQFADFRAEPLHADLDVRLQQELAAKLFLEGFPKEARELLPSTGPVVNSADLLRDMRALVLGRGEVTTWPVQQVLKAEFDSDGVKGRPAPPGVSVLIPASEWSSWQAPVLGPRTSGGSSLDQLARLEKPLRDKIASSLQKERQVGRQRGTAVAQEIQTLLQQRRQSADEDAQLFLSLETQLQRKLTSTERILAWQMRRQGQQTSEVAAALRQFPR
jgi:hypothetical protein